METGFLTEELLIPVSFLALRSGISFLSLLFSPTSERANYRFLVVCSVELRLRIGLKPSITICYVTDFCLRDPCVNRTPPLSDGDRQFAVGVCDRHLSRLPRWSGPTQTPASNSLRSMCLLYRLLSTQMYGASLHCDD